MDVSFSKLTGRLLLNGLRFRYLLRRGIPGKPQALSLEITHDCVAKCVMCNIWKIPHDVPNLSVEAWIDLLASDLFSDLRELDVTGGEPYTRVDLPNLFSGICNLRQNNLKQLRSIAVTTNGLLPEASKIRRMVGRYPQCKDCTEPGLERYALPYEGFSYLLFLIKTGREDFLQFHQHMGLDKYLN